MSLESMSKRDVVIRLVVTAVVVAILLIIVFQNAQTVSINLLVWEIESRLIWALLGVALLGFLAGLILPRFRR